jgi:molybdenum cofactor biosynthesis protein B
MQYDESYPFRPVRIAILTVSDTRTEADDKSGKLLKEMLEADGHILAAKAIIRDDAAQIQAQVREWIADPSVETVITTGGTGLTGRDVTPEAIRPLFEKEIDGFSVLMHMLSFQNVGTSTMQSRALAGVAGGTYIFCVPGSSGACKDAWTMIIRHQLDSRHRPCNMVDIMPRLMEHKR